VTKYGPYSREVLRALRREWLRRHRGFFIGAAFVALVILGALTTWTALFAPDSRLASFVLGATYVGAVATFLHGLHTGFLLGVPDGIRQLRGAYGEENTREELRAAKRRRLIWCWVDSIGLERGDLDHFVVTRRGGVLVLDSKWHNQTNATDTQAMAAAARRLRTRAEALTRSLLLAERARHRARVDSVRVRPVVVLWGAEQHRLPDGLAQDGIDFVAGRHLRTWLRQLEGDLVSKAAAAQLQERLLEFRESSAARRQPAQS
jgi:Nuclease-related domain